MRNFTTAVSATVTAIVIGLLIANVASAARAAEIQHDKDAELAQLQDAAYSADMTTQLKAYQTRYGEAYKQLAAAYQAYYARDAEYRAIVGRANANAAQLANANATLEAKLNDAYQALRDAQALVASLQGKAPATQGAAPVTQNPAAPVPGAAPAPAPTAAPRTAAPGRYCWYDHEGHLVCEDHPQGGD